jgi:hypothetical protein
MRMFLRLQYLELDELPGTSARRRNLYLIYLCGFFVCLGFLAAFIELAFASHGHLRTPPLDWLFNTPFGVVAFTVLAILVVGLPLVAAQWCGGLTRAQLAEAPDMTDATPDAWKKSRLDGPLNARLASGLGWGGASGP